MQKKIAILLSTFNGEKYLREQIESILNQTNKEWDLLIRDDSSCDNTVNIIKEFENKHPQIHFVHDDLGNIRPLRSFKKLLSYINGYDYIMFCDQDDIWYPDKIQLSFDKIKQVEVGQKYALVYTNYIVNRRNENTIAYNHSMTSKNIPSNILAQSWLMGCTMIMNNNMADIAKKIPVESENHDNWYAKVACLITKIGYVHEPTMMHRLHENNATNRISTSSKKVQIVALFKFWKLKNETYTNFVITADNIFKLVCKDSIKNKEATDTKIFMKYKTMFQSIMLKKIFILIKYKFRAFSFNQNIKFLIVVLFGKVNQFQRSDI